jgi:tRNA nucleotidyltransferase (CCA-adding enzyme)
MQVYLVGGAVRDMLMGLEPKDRDYVVVGSCEAEMLSLGFTKVGADFPVFLHPETGDEYALARRERKTGKGYLGFVSEFTPDVTLEEDLSRRDLTINSIAMEEELDNPGNFLVHDYFGGQDDLRAKILRHTSNAFEEDPVRVLRVARFCARFGSDWQIAEETKDLIRKMGKSGMLGVKENERV